MSVTSGVSRILAGRYRLTEALGRGGMGSVWKAEHLTLRSPVAVKLIDPSIASNPDALARFYREAQAAAALRSSHVVQVLDYGIDGNEPYIVMELLQGETLSAKLAHAGKLSPAVTSHVLTEVARAMSRAHETNIVHRDLKPDNVFIVREGDHELAKVLDFGIAKAHLEGNDGSRGGVTQTGMILGTPYYMSPEQAEGLSNVDYRTDIWSFGVIAYECLLGTVPFAAPTVAGIILAICVRPLPVPSQVGPVPAGFDDWFATACARQPERRFPSAREAADSLRKICLGESGAVSHAPASESSRQARDNVAVRGPATASPFMATPAPGGPRSNRLLLPLTVTCLALAGATGYLLLRPAAPSPVAPSPGAGTHASAAPHETPAARPSANTPPIEPVPSSNAAPVTAPSAAPVTAPSAAASQAPNQRRRGHPPRPAPAVEQPSHPTSPPSKPEIDLGI